MLKIRIEALENGFSFKPETIRFASVALASVAATVLSGSSASPTTKELQEFVDFLDGMVKANEVDEFNKARRFAAAAKAACR